MVGCVVSEYEDNDLQTPTHNVDIDGHVNDELANYYSYTYEAGDSSYVYYQSKNDYTRTYERCACGADYAHEVRRQLLTPPVNLRWEGSNFIDNFNYIHTFAYIEYSVERRDTLEFWVDAPLRDFSFVKLGYCYLEGLQFYVQETLFTIPEFLPTDVFVLNVALLYSIPPRGGVIFLDEDGIQRYMLIIENQRGGCFPPIIISYWDDIFHFTK